MQWDLLQNTQYISSDDARKTYTTGHEETESIFNSLGVKDVLNRNFGGLGWGSFRALEKSKRPFAAKVEWLGEDGAFGNFARHPPSISDCNTEGKTMVVYRFPRQLDPVADKGLLDFYAANGLPDYSITNTKHCYPYPGSSASYLE